MQQYCEKLFEQFGSNTRVVELFGLNPNEAGKEEAVVVTDATISDRKFRGGHGFSFDGDPKDGGQANKKSINKDGKVEGAFEVEISQMGDPSRQNQETQLSVYTADPETKVTVVTQGSIGE